MMTQKATKQLTIGTPCTWIIRYPNGLAVTIYAVIADVRRDGRYVLRYPGKSGRGVQRIANAASVSAR